MVSNKSSKTRFASVMMLVIALVSLSSCVSKDRLVLFQDSDQYLDPKRIASTYDIRVQADDQLAISVASEFPELVAVFNNKTFIGSAANGGGMSMGMSGGGGSGSSSSGLGATNLSGFHVDKDGNIDFPIFGKIRVEGLSRREVADLIQERLRDGYIKDAVVSVELLSFHVVVLGASNKETILTINKDRCTIIEALTMAGGFKQGAYRDNALVVREENGTVWTYRVDFTSLGDLLNSPVYYLQQNDIIYLEPNGAASVDESPAQKYMSIITSTIGFAAGIAAVILAL